MISDIWIVRVASENIVEVEVDEGERASNKQAGSGTSGSGEDIILEKPTEDTRRTLAPTHPLCSSSLTFSIIALVD
jgi:hypothetical protein